MKSMSLGCGITALGMGKGKRQTRSWQAPVLGRKVRRGQKVLTLVRLGRNMYLYCDRRLFPRIAIANLYSAGTFAVVSACADKGISNMQ